MKQKLKVFVICDKSGRVVKDESNLMVYVKEDIAVDEASIEETVKPGTLVIP